jgi:hypothetical protein
VNIASAILAKPAWWFFAACAVFAAVLIGEWLPAAEPPHIARPIIAHVQKPHAAAAADSAGDKDSDGKDGDAKDSDAKDGDAKDADAKDSDEWADTITARPLFTVGRRPPKAKSVGVAVADSGMPRLSGIIVTGASRRAIFMPDSGKAVVVAEGANLDDATVRRIAIDRVFISGPKGDMVLYPSFDHNRTPPAPCVPSGANFPQAGGPMGFPQNFNPGFNGATSGVQPPNTGNGDDNDDSSPQPTPPIPPPQLPGGFRNPMFPRRPPQ